MYKQEQGRPNVGGTGNGITSKLAGPDPKKPIPTKKDPNLSSKEKALVYDGNLPESTWKKFNKEMRKTGVPLSQGKIDKARSIQQKRDSAYIVDNRFTTIDRSVGGSTYGSAHTSYNKQKTVPARDPKKPSTDYMKNTFYRDKKTGKLSIKELNMR